MESSIIFQRNKNSAYLFVYCRQLQDSICVNTFSINLYKNKFMKNLSLKMDDAVFEETEKITVKFVRTGTDILMKPLNFTTYYKEGN